MTEAEISGKLEANLKRVMDNFIGEKVDADLVDRIQAAAKEAIMAWYEEYFPNATDKLYPRVLVNGSSVQITLEDSSLLN